jgi:hypothetical protein
MSADNQNITAIIDAQIGSTRGSVLFRGASGWTILTPGTSTYVLTSNGSGADPSYQAGGGGGGGGSPGGSTTQIQYNSSGAFAGLSTLTTPDGVNLDFGALLTIQPASYGTAFAVNNPSAAAVITFDSYGNGTFNGNLRAGPTQGVTAGAFNNAGYIFSLTGSTLQVGSGFQILFGNSTYYFATKDLGLARLSAGILTITDGSTGTGTIQANLQTNAAAVTGLTPGVLAATTNASIELFDSTGQAYRVPCII